MGIANIINTAGGGGGGGSEIITNLVNSVDGAGLRLANQGYISCADVSANRFGTNDFSVEFVLSQETNAVNADIFISNLNGSNQAVDAAVIRWDVVQNDNIQLVFTNSGASETAYNFGYDPAPDLNEPTHYLVSADRSGNAVLYRNGAEIASVSIAASGSANVGNSGQPTVIGSPVNNFGVKGNVYRLRTYSKALSSDEAKNVFDRADVPTALVSNLLLDLDCAYANPTQSTVIQDRGPNNQDGTLNGTITQTNVIKQLNSVSARIGTSAATPADGEIISSGKISANSKVNINSNGTLDWGYAADYGMLTWGGTTDAIVRGATSKNLILGANNQNFVTIDTNGQVGVGCDPANPLQVEKASAATSISNAQNDNALKLSNYSTAADGQFVSLGLSVAGTSGATADSVIAGYRDGAGNSSLRFYTESGNTLGERLTIDSTGAVTVNETAGSATNSTKLEVRSDADGSTSAIRTTNKDVTAGTNQAAGVDFGLSRNSGAFKPQAGQIKVGRESDWDASDTNIDSYMAFSTYSNNALGERLRIASDGNIEQHTDSNGIVKFGVKNESTGTSARAMVNVLSDSGNLDLSMNGSNYTGVAGWADSGTISTGSGASGGLKINAVVGGLALQTNQTTRLSIANSTGLATFSGGITVSGGFLSLDTPTELTIASNAVTVTRSFHDVDTEGDAATDD